MCEALNNLSQQLSKLLRQDNNDNEINNNNSKSNISVKELCIIFGSTPLQPKEIYRLQLHYNRADCTTNNESGTNDSNHAINATTTTTTEKTIRKIFQQIMLNQCIGQKDLLPTKLFLLVKGNRGLLVNQLLPKQNYKPIFINDTTNNNNKSTKKKRKRYEIYSLHFGENIDVCSECKAEDNGSNNNNNNNNNNNPNNNNTTTNDNNNIQNNEQIDDDCLWYQSSYTISGFTLNSNTTSDSMECSEFE